MSSTEIKNEIIKALKINSLVDWDSNDTTTPNEEFLYLIDFVERLFEED